jgi:hypothetical protein
MKRRTVFVVLAALVAISLASAGSADAQEMDCAMCHPDKAEGAAVHPGGPHGMHGVSYRGRCGRDPAHL